MSSRARSTTATSRSPRPRPRARAGAAATPGEPMRAVILAGGKGTRLRPYTTVLPKPLVPIADRPILELIIRQLAAHGFTRIDLLVGPLGGLIKTYLDSAVLPDGLELQYRWEDAPLGT